MPWAVAAAAIGAGASIYSASSGADAQADAAAQANATQMASIEENRRQFDQTTANFKPFLESGYDSLASLKKLMGGGPESLDFLRNMPGYQFQFDQGEEALLHSASARGGVAGGNTLRELTKFGQGLADQSIWKYIAQLTGQAESGQAAAGNQAGFGAASAAANQNARNGIANNQIGMGNVNAAGQVATGTSIANMFNNPQVVDALRSSFGGGDDGFETWTYGF